jgi:pimeloyl-ACP methyl ester carboxylesterase/DNA-binding winged helix-turn-helix (wHTH) protein
MLYRFGEFELDTRRCELSRAGEPLHLEPQVYAVLCYLVENRDRLVTREELLDHVWGHRFITPATLNTRLKALRHALDDDGATQRVIRTVRGRGLRFVGEVETVPAHEGGSSAPPGSTASGRFATADEGVEQEIRFFRSDDGTRIAYATSGSGPPLVKTANWLTHLEFDWISPVWRPWLQELSRSRTLIRYDERGSGLSDHDVEDFSFERWVEDLEGLVDALELERFPLFGVSQGAAVAIAYAARHPERVSGLVLYGGYPQGRYRRPMTPAEREEAEMRTRILPLGWDRDTPAFRQFFSMTFLPEGTPEQLQWFGDLLRVTTSPRNAVRLLDAAAEIDVGELAARVQAPTLVLHATGDAAVPFDQGCCLASLIPGARFVPLESRNHVLMQWEPAWTRFLREVRAFLAELEDADELARGQPGRVRDD